MRVLGFVVLAILISNPAAAQEVAPASGGDEIVENLKQAIDGMGGRIAPYAIWFLTSLFVIDIIITFGRATLQGTGLGETLNRFIIRLLIITLAIFFINSVSQFVEMFINAAIRLGSEASDQKEISDIAVSTIVNEALAFASDVIGLMDWKQIGTAIILGIVIIIGLIIGAVIAALVILAYAEMYFVAFMGVFILGFAGLSSTTGAAITYVKTLVGQALKLMALLVTYAFMAQLTTGLAGPDGVTFDQALSMLMVQVITLVLVATLPGSLQQLAGGLGSSGSFEMTGRMGAKTGLTASAVAAGAASAASLGGIGGGLLGGGKGAWDALQAGGGADQALKDLGKGLGKGVAPGVRTGLKYLNKARGK